jgi:23S rRNA (cytidine1920-2'-O)/16S rRNA (cytidine1409-2'-O)-methyltransferase
MKSSSGDKKRSKIRADELVLKLGLCETRTKAQAYILAGQVKLGTEIIDKTSRMLDRESKITLEHPSPYVGRGGFKMKSFFEKSPIPIKGNQVLDLGASTGGFTDYFLQNGATSATCVDVGHGQLHYKLRKDPRVKNIEKTNLRTLTEEKLDQSTFPFVVMDMSFISLKKVLEKAWSFTAEEGYLIALVKPQFECKKEEADRAKGVIKDTLIQKRVIKEIINFAKSYLKNAELYAQVDSTPKGNDGNQEFFICWKKITANQSQ